jgi:hypothetical protein
VECAARLRCGVEAADVVLYDVQAILRACGVHEALLSERDLMEQPIQAAIALTVEPVTHAAGAGGFQRCNTGQGGKLGFAKAWPRRSELGNQGCRRQWTQARDGLGWGEPPGDSTLELGRDSV